MSSNENGLLGYYFGDDILSQLRFIAPTENDQLGFLKEGLAEKVLQSEIQAVRWVGSIQILKQDVYTVYTDFTNSLIQIDGETVYPSQKVILERGKHSIMIESLLDPVSAKDFSPITLFLNDKPVPKIQLFLPNSKDDKLIPEHSLHEDKEKTSPESGTLEPDEKKNNKVLLDSDNDGIPDDMETNGYTVMNKMLVPWDDDYAKLGYKKYVSNPYNSRTANDPYTDLEKVTGQFDKGIDLIARDPMVAACPVISAHLEKLIMSKNETIGGQMGASVSKNVSSSFSSSNTVGASVTTEFGYNVFPHMNVSVSANYSNTTQKTHAVSDTKSKSFSESLSLNVGQAAFINLNVRYFNTGTAPVYNLSPNVTFSIDHSSIFSVQAQENQTAGYLNADSSYPAFELPPIVFNTMDQFSSHLIQISQNQLQEIDSGKPVHLSVSQFKGNFGKFNLDGNLVTSGNDWAPYLAQIESTTATFILETPTHDLKEFKIAANSPDDIEDTTPSLTILEALKKLDHFDYVDEKILYQGKPFDYYNTVNITMDQHTKEVLDRQMSDNKAKNLMSCRITPRMNIHVKIQKTKLDVIPNGSYVIRPSYEENLILTDTQGVKLSQFIDSGYQKWHFIYEGLLGGYRIRSEKIKEGFQFLTWDKSKKTITLQPHIAELPGAEQQLWIPESYEGSNNYIFRCKGDLNLNFSFDMSDAPVLTSQVTVDSVWNLTPVNSWEASSYYIIPKTDTDKRLDFQNGIYVISKPAADTTEQLWALEEGTGKYLGHYSIKSVKSLIYMTHFKTGTTSTLRFLGYDSTTEDKFYWKILESQNKGYSILPFGDNRMAITVSNNNVTLQNFVNSDAQKFFITP